jgi:hypothetical protein
MSAIRLNLELSTQTSLYSSFEQICDELEALESTGELEALESTDELEALESRATCSRNHVICS